ncbi:MAG: tetratricopeptide repeat protein [Pirellulales bacterium]|nr:tetratricopeptide repeat protein [Pirellulales bacterium]
MTKLPLAGCPGTCASWLLRVAMILALGSMAPRLAIAGPIDINDPGVASLPTQSDIRELDDAIERFKKSDFKGAKALLEIAAKEHPALPPADMMFARLCVTAGMLAEARDALEQAVETDPSYPDAYLIIARLAFGEGRVTEAELVYAKAANVAGAYSGDEKKKRDFVLRAARGQAEVALVRKQWDAALKYLDKCLEIDNTDTVARYNRGIALFGLDKASEAFKEFETAYGDGKDERFLPPGVAVARLYDRAGNAAKADEWRQFAAKRSPNDPKTHVAIAQWLWQTGKPEHLENAATHAFRALQLAPDMLEAKIILGTVLRYRREFAKAEEPLQSAVTQSPGSFAAANQLALALCEQGDEAKRKKAIELAQLNANRVDARDPRRGEAMATLAWTHYRNGQTEQAYRFIRQAYDVRQVSSDTAYYLAVIESTRGNKDRSRQLLKDALAAAGPFAYRDDATKLLDTLEQASAAATSQGPGGN